MAVIQPGTWRSTLGGSILATFRGPGLADIRSVIATYYDPTNVFNPGTTPSQSRIVVIEGAIVPSPPPGTAYLLSTDFSSFGGSKLLDQVFTGILTATLSAPIFSQDGVLSVILCAPTPNATLFICQLFLSGAEAFDQVAHSPAAVPADSSSPSGGSGSGSSGGSSGSGSSGGSSGSGDAGQGGGSGPLPLPPRGGRPIVGSPS